ncbi:hypothetical protein RCG19_00630 [Neobacillus sp. OS1-2]|uniref:hypothetical protein n=1 Tax=Neobacillus sp. OS1-2 TaxID=3070680 RepID=UPI0027DF0E1A|nr:hypothetical protein [Neobacillus sp. OS1-2]WML40225.1 hypothetical protein RCG19_00630 [Neobacillus sp. OS1-2]
MSNLQLKLEAFINDVNCEDGRTVKIMEQITDSMFFLIKWAAIPFIIYLLFVISS